MPQHLDLIPTHRWRKHVAVALVVLAGGLVYSNSFTCAFVFDDLTAIVDNSSIRHLWPLRSILFPPNQGLLNHGPVDGRPLLNLTFALNYAAGGLNVWGYHVVNISIHILAGIVLFGIIQRTLLLRRHRGRRSSDVVAVPLVAALLWIVHPLQTESVTYICQRAEALAGLLYLLTVYFSLRSLDGGHRSLWQCGSLLACALGMCVKEVTVTAPLLVLIYDWVFVDEPLRRIWRRRCGFYLALMGCWLVLVGIMVEVGGSNFDILKDLIANLMHAGGRAKLQMESAWQPYALSQFGAIVRYLRLSLWPMPLIFDYGTSTAQGFSEIAFPAAIVALMAIGTIIGLVRRNWLGFLGAWFLLILAPSSSIVPLRSQTMAEHRVYLSLAAVLVVGVVCIKSTSEFLEATVFSRIPGGVTGGAIFAFVAVGWIGSLGWRTMQRNGDYRSNYAIWSDTVVKLPENSRAHCNLGVALLEMGKPNEAVASLNIALNLKPNSAEAHNDLGHAFLVMGKADDAMAQFKSAVALEPNYAVAQNNLGVLLLQKGRLEEALAHCRMAVEIQPAFADGHVNLANALLLDGKESSAVDDYRQALLIDRDNLSGLTNLAWTLATARSSSIRDGSKAIELAERANRLSNGKSPLVLHTLAAAFAEVGRFSDALRYAKRALELTVEQGDKVHADAIRQECNLYRAGRSLRDTERGR